MRCFWGNGSEMGDVFDRLVLMVSYEPQEFDLLGFRSQKNCDHGLIDPVDFVWS